MKLPKKISPCPIVEAIIEIRFESDMPEDAIFGVIYNQFKNDYTKLEKNPILELPLQIRSNDPNLKFQPHYKLKNDNFILQIGPKVFSLVNINEYCGWDIFFEKGCKTIDKLLELKILSKIGRIGLRYINLFRNINIYEKSNLKILLGDNLLNKNRATLNLEIPKGNYVNHFKMINGADAIIEKSIVKGSIIDIDTVLMDHSITFEDVGKIISEAHNIEKDFFFSLLENDFIKSLNPVY